MLMVNIEMISMIGLYEINNNRPKQPLLDLLFFLQVGLKENVISSNRLPVVRDGNGADRDQIMGDPNPPQTINM